VLPLPEDVLADLRRTLDQVITPALSDGFALEQASLMSSLLEHLRLRTVHEFDLLVADSTEVRRTLERLDIPQDIVVRLESVPETARTAVSLEALRSENLALRAILAEIVALSDEWEDRSALQATLRNQLDRDRSIIGPGYRTGT
jgi:hypothetical protein